MTRLLLASKSPRRRQLLGELGFPMEVVDLTADEHLTKPVPVDQMAEGIALRKAEAFRGTLEEGDVLVTADTVVVHRQRPMGKPASRDEAIAMLQMLSDCTHQVYTGVCLRGSKSLVGFTECTNVSFHYLTQREIAYYVDTYRPYDKAGSYGIQEWIGMVGIDRIEGCYYNVMGLPVAHLYKELKRLVNGDLALVDE